MDLRCILFILFSLGRGEREREKEREKEREGGGREKLGPPFWSPNIQIENEIRFAISPLF